MMKESNVKRGRGSWSCCYIVLCSHLPDESNRKPQENSVKVADEQDSNKVPKAKPFIIALICSARTLL